MICSKCGEPGHNKRSCKEQELANTEERNRVILFRIDHMTQNEQDNMHIELVKLKKKVTSSEARATLVEGTQQELPSKIRAMIDDEDNKTSS